MITPEQEAQWNEYLKTSGNQNIKPTTSGVSSTWHDDIEKKLEEVRNQKEQDVGMFQSLVRGAASPFLGAGTGAYQALSGGATAAAGVLTRGVTGVAGLLGKEDVAERGKIGSSNLMGEAVEQIKPKDVDMGYFGKITPVGAKQGGGFTDTKSQVLDAAGTGLELGSWLLGLPEAKAVVGGITKKGLGTLMKEGAKLGSAAGATGMAGVSLQEQAKDGEFSAGKTAMDTLIGAAAGGLFGMATPVVFRPFEAVRATAKGLGGVVAKVGDAPDAALTRQFEKPAQMSKLAGNVTPEAALRRTQMGVRTMRKTLTDSWNQFTDKMIQAFSGKRTGFSESEQRIIRNVADEYAIELPQNLFNLSAKEAMGFYNRLNEALSSGAAQSSPKYAALRSLHDSMRNKLVNSFGGKNGLVDRGLRDYSTNKTIMDAMDDLVKAWKTKEPIAQKTALGRLMSAFNENATSYLEAIKSFEKSTGIPVSDYISSALTSRKVGATDFGIPISGKGGIDAIVNAILAPLRSPRGAAAVERVLGRVAAGAEKADIATTQATEVALGKMAQWVKANKNATVEEAEAVWQAIKSGASDINEKVKDMPMGLSIEDVSKRKPSAQAIQTGIEATQKKAIIDMATDSLKKLQEKDPEAWVNIHTLLGDIQKAKRGVDTLDLQHKLVQEMKLAGVLDETKLPRTTAEALGEPPKANAVASAKTADPLLEEAKKYKTAEEFVRAQTKRPEYGYGHSPNEDGVRAFDLTENVGGEQMIPKDMYEQWYGSRGTPEDLESIAVLKRIKGNPEAEVTIYRASPKDEWNYGDWITLSKKYARTHAEGNNLNVFSKKVRAKDIRWAMDDINEFGYFPESIKSQLTDIWNKANKGELTPHDAELVKTLRGTRGMSADDIMSKHPDIQLKKEVSATDIYGNKVKIPEGEALTPYEMKGNKIVLQDGETYVVTKNQYQNIKNQSLSGEAVEFAPELKGTEESIKAENVRILTKAEEKELLRLQEIQRELETNDVAMVSLSQAERARLNELTNKSKKQSELIASSRTKYNRSDLVLPGGENYKEVLIKAPIGKETLKNAKGEVILEKSNGQVNDVFKSSHWSEPNVIAHIRLNERTYNGKKVTFMEEVQSDWAREARAGNTTATAPQLKKWQELGIKRALKDAADNDSDYFAWINGEQTANRYNLATHIESVKWEPDIYKGSGKRIQINPNPRGGANHGWDIPIGDDGIVASGGGAIPSDWKGKRIDEVLGKGLADKIMEKESGNLSGEGLKFGGEWTNNLYDKQVKSIVEDLTGQKVEMLDMGLGIDSSPKQVWKIIRPDKKGTPIYADFTADLTPQNLKAGQRVGLLGSGELASSPTEYIITDVLGDGKFKAINKEEFNRLKDGYYGGDKLGQMSKDLRQRILDDRSETFNISSPTTQQMGIKLTPEIKAKIKGEAPKIKSPSGVMY